VTFIGFSYYKRKTKRNKKGDFKSVNIKKENTPLSITLTYLSRYGMNSTMSYIKEQIEKEDIPSTKLKMYKNILRYVNKFGFDRLMNLAISRREKVINRYSDQPIEFKSFTFSGRSRKN